MTFFYKNIYSRHCGLPKFHLLNKKNITGKDLIPHIFGDLLQVINNNDIDIFEIILSKMLNRVIIDYKNIHLLNCLTRYCPLNQSNSSSSLANHLINLPLNEPIIEVNSDLNGSNESIITANNELIESIIIENREANESIILENSNINAAINKKTKRGCRGGRSKNKMKFNNRNKIVNKNNNNSINNIYNTMSSASINPSSLINHKPNRNFPNLNPPILTVNEPITVGTRLFNRLMSSGQIDSENQRIAVQSQELSSVSSNKGEYSGSCYDSDNGSDNNSNESNNNNNNNNNKRNNGRNKTRNNNNKKQKVLITSSKSNKIIILENNNNNNNNNNNEVVIIDSHSNDLFQYECESISSNSINNNDSNKNDSNDNNINNNNEDEYNEDNNDIMSSNDSNNYTISSNELNSDCGMFHQYNSRNYLTCHSQVSNNDNKSTKININQHPNPLNLVNNNSTARDNIELSCDVKSVSEFIKSICRRTFSIKNVWGR
jgi:hypothetical protein